MIQREMGDLGLATRHSVGFSRPEGLDDDPGKSTPSGVPQGLHPSGCSEAAPTGEGARLRALIDEHYDFIWRTLRRLGVPPSDLDDAAQQVFVVVSRKLSVIEVDRERPFVFQTALRVASDARRTVRRRREVIDPTLLDGVDTAPGPDDIADRKRARALFDAVLDDMPLDLRAVFVLFEVEELSSIEIGRLLGVPTGTVASRLRRARADFQTRVGQLEQLEAKRGESR